MSNESLLEHSIPEGRRQLIHSHENLLKVATYCEQNYLSANDKNRALEETKVHIGFNFLRELFCVFFIEKVRFFWFVSSWISFLLSGLFFLILIDFFFNFIFLYVPKKVQEKTLYELFGEHILFTTV